MYIERSKNTLQFLQEISLLVFCIITEKMSVGA